MKSKKLYTAIFIAIYSFCNYAYSAPTCASLLQASEVDLVTAQVRSLINKDIELFAEELAITEDEVKSSKEDGPDMSYVFQSDDPFTNRVCRLSSMLVLHYLEQEGYDPNSWVEYITVHNAKEQKIIDEAVAAKTDAEYEVILLRGTFGKYMGAVDHSVVFNAELGILIDLTYRQYLINKIPKEDFDLLPRVFIGSLSEFRALVEPHLGKPTVDRILSSAAADDMGVMTTNENKPTLAELDSGEKTFSDVIPLMRMEDLSGVEDMNALPIIETIVQKEAEEHEPSPEVIVMSEEEYEASLRDSQ